MDSFYATVERVDRNLGKDMPIAVGGTKRRGIILSATYPAKTKGVKTGMLVSHAKRLCPELQVFPPDFEKYEKYSDKFTKILYKYSPHVFKYSIDECFVDFRGCERLWKNPLYVSSLIVSEIKEKTGLDSSIGISSSMTYAKMLSKLAKPGGILFLFSGEEIFFFASFPIKTVPGIGKKIANFFNSIDVKNIEQLISMNSKSLEKYLGVNGGKIFNSLKNLSDNNVPQELKFPRSMGREETFDRDITDIMEFKERAFFFLQLLCSKLRIKKLAAKKLTVKVRYSNFLSNYYTYNFKRFINHEELMKEKLFELVKALKINGVGIRKIGVIVEDIYPVDTMPTLFEINEIERLKKLNKTVDKIRLKYGECSVLKGEIRGNLPPKKFILFPIREGLRKN